MGSTMIAVIKLAVRILEAPLERTLRGYRVISGAEDDPDARQVKNRRHPRLPNLVLKCSFNDDRDITREVLIYKTEEKVSDQTVRFRRKLVVFDTERGDIALFDLIADYHRHPQAWAKLVCKRGLAGSLPAGDDDALWFL